jgi:formylglycine-generating enzyme required for sulfatase activity
MKSSAAISCLLSLFSLLPLGGARQLVQNMVRIGGASFDVGIDPEEIPRLLVFFALRRAELFNDEIPIHRVSVGDFLLDEHLVTNSQFREFVRAVPQWRKDRVDPDLHNGDYLKAWTGDNFSQEKSDHPVVFVSWYAAAAYCRWQHKRLPREVEWEYAARGGLEHPVFPWGDQPADPSRANFSGRAIRTTTPVHKYPPNGYGLFDMAGNVWQFMADEWKPYGRSEQSTPTDDSMVGDSYRSVQTRRVIRGGSWGGAPVNLWVEYRDSHPPRDARDFVGFRCAANPN